jgi:hypothetical protein
MLSTPHLVIYCVSIHEWIEIYGGSGQSVDLGGRCVGPDSRRGERRVYGSISRAQSTSPPCRLRIAAWP